jgi:hypothetical protein
MLRQFCLLVLFSFGILSLGAEIAPANETAKELAGQASADIRLLTTFGRMERAIGDLDHALTHGIIATAGGWSVLEGSANPAVIRATAENTKRLATEANDGIQRSRTATDFQKERSAKIFGSFEAMLVAVDKIADALSDNNTTEARQIYQSEYQQQYAEALRVAKTSTFEIEKELSGTLIRLRFVK